MNIRRTLASVSFVLLACITASAQNLNELQARIPQIERFINEQMKQQSVPGLSIAIAKYGRIVYAKGFGYADLENKVPFTAQTVSRIGSISKTFTAAAVMQLVEQGKINLDAEVQTYVPTFPKKQWPITIRQLLGHQGGIRHYKGAEMLSNVRYDSVEASLAIFKNDDLIAQPGTKYSYTTYGYNLLSRVVEATSGLTFGDYLQQRIFTPLALKQTYLDYPNRIVANRARNYSKPENGELENAPQVDQSNKWGGGGLLSTVEDLIHYANGYEGGRLLQPQTVQQMFTPQKTRDGNLTGYGLGWTSALENNRRRIEHNGGSIGATASLAKYPEQGITIAVLVNCNHYTAPDFKAGIVKILFGDGPTK